MSDATVDVPQSVNHVFVDFENVHAFDPKLVGNKAVRFTLLLGPLQTKLNIGIVEELLKHAATVEIVRMNAPGRNAVDFALAYYVGRSAVTDPMGYFHIVSKDTGFDPLIAHLKAKGIRIRRHDGFETLTFTAQAKAAHAPSEVLVVKSKPPIKQKGNAAIHGNRVAEMLGHLRQHGNNRPRRKATLVSHILAFFANSVLESDALKIIKDLEHDGHLSINAKGLVEYRLTEDTRSLEHLVVRAFAQPPARG